MAALQQDMDRIEADEHDDSGIDSGSLASSTTSIGSSILKSREENGRTYHAYKVGKYALPNDAGEQDRLDLQHHLCLITFDGKATLIPQDGKKKIHRVLDVGTGTGLWAIDYADEHPEAQVLGVDLSPIQPNFLPPNLVFEIDDLEEPWLYREKFDFIHCRMMTGSFRDWPKFFRQAFSFLTPDGYLELSDSIFEPHYDDDTLKPDSALAKWCEMLLAASIKAGAPINSAHIYKEEMEKAGFVNIVERKDVWPGGTWPKDSRLKELGLWNRTNMLDGLEAFTLGLFTRQLGWSPEAVQVFIVDVRKQMKDPKIHYYMYLNTIYGKKPE